MYKVIEVSHSGEIPMFRLEDLNQRPIIGKFYAQEVSVVDYNPENVFQIEKILCKKKISGKIHYRVKWSGYGNSANSWVPASELMELGENTLVSGVE